MAGRGQSAALSLLRLKTCGDPPTGGAFPASERREAAANRRGRAGLFFARQPQAGSHTGRRFRRAAWHPTCEHRSQAYSEMEPKPLIISNGTSKGPKKRGSALDWGHNSLTSPRFCKKLRFFWLDGNTSQNKCCEGWAVSGSPLQPKIINLTKFQRIALLVQSALDGYRVAILAYGLGSSQGGKLGGGLWVEAPSMSAFFEGTFFPLFFPNPKGTPRF